MSDSVANHHESDALLQFQLTQEGIADKSSKEYGLSICKKIFGTVNSGMGGYYFARNARWTKNRNYASGRIDVKQMFQDRLDMNAKPNYIALNWQTLQIVNRIISGLVGRWMQRNEKVVVKAIDSLSQNKKQDEYEQVEFLVYNRQQLEQLQQQSGVQMVPQDDSLPQDKDDLILWRAELQRLPEEILYEMGCNDVLGSNGLFDVLKEKLLHDSAEVMFVGTYTWMDDDGVVHVDWVKPENAIYSYTDYPDMRDTAWRGQMPSLKISDIRKRWGKEFHPENKFALSEEQLWQVAQKCKEYQLNTNISWVNDWYTSFLRPYDEWNIKVMEFELRSVDSEPYTVTKTKTGGTTYTERGYPATKGGKRREKPLENQKIVEDTNWNIYRGVYLPDLDMILEWGLKKNMIRPQDPREVGNAEFSYSYYMSQVQNMRNMAVPEKIEAAVDGMILSLLKMQQVVARMRPTGAAIDESALQNIDYGLGADGNKAVDPKRVYDQTGDIYYRGTDAEGNRLGIPITELANSGFLGQMQGLISIYQFHYQTLKDELGEDPNLISAALQPRVAEGNVEASQATGNAATDYMYRAYLEVMKMTSRKVSCLLKDSVQYGAKAYRDLAQIDDLDKRVFTTDIRMLPTEPEVAAFSALLNQAMVSTPELVLFVDPFQLVRIAKEDVKLAEIMFRRGQKRMLSSQQQQAAQNTQQTAQAQQQSALIAEQAKRESMKAELQLKGQNEAWSSKYRKEEIVLQGIMQWGNTILTPKKSGEGDTGASQPTPQLPPQLMQLMELAVRNIAMPLAADNASMQGGTSVETTGPGADEQQQDNGEEQGQQQSQNQPPQQVAQMQ